MPRTILWPQTLCTCKVWLESEGGSVCFHLCNFELSSSGGLHLRFKTVDACILDAWTKSKDNQKPQGRKLLVCALWPPKNLLFTRNSTYDKVFLCSLHKIHVWRISSGHFCCECQTFNVPVFKIPFKFVWHEQPIKSVFASYNCALYH